MPVIQPAKSKFRDNTSNNPNMNRYHLTLLSATLLAAGLSSTLHAQTEIPPADPWNVKSVDSADYPKATANEPHFENKELWPEEIQKAGFIKQTWPKTRVLVWAGGTNKVSDGWEAKYWIEDGKPATVPFDENTDLVFPDNEGGFTWVSLTAGRKYQPAAFRHLTLGKGCGVIGHFSVGGNTWIKKGGNVQYLDSCVGKGNTFLRNDNDDINLVDHFHFNKAPGWSCEFIGRFSSGDNWQINSGLMILSTDSRIGTGNRTDTTINEDGALAILSGSYFSRRLNADWGFDLLVKGKFSAGLPDRPLIRDARLGLGYKSKGSFINKSGEPGNRTPSPADFGMIVTETGSFNVVADAARKARLIVNCHKLEPDWGQLGIQWRNRELDPVAGRAAAEAVPRLSDMVLLGKADMSNVRFEDIAKGGIHMANPAMASQWNNVELGANNGGTLKELVAPYKKP